MENRQRPSAFAPPSGYFEWQEFSALLESNPALKKILTPVEQNGTSFHFVAQHFSSGDDIRFYVVNKDGKMCYFVAEFSHSDDKSMLFSTDDDIIQTLLGEQQGEIMPIVQTKQGHGFSPLTISIKFSLQKASKKLRYFRWGLIAFACFLVGLGLGSLQYYLSSQSALQTSVQQIVSSGVY